MALDEGGSTGIPATMLVGPANVGGGAYPYPVFGGMGGNGGSNGWGGDGSWIILLIIVLLAAGGGWGNNNGGGFSGQPIIVNDGGGSSVQRGFDQAAVMSGINALTSNVCNGFANVQQSLCNGFAGVNATVNGGFANAETAANARAMSTMQQLFGLQSQFAECCCENRLATANLANVIQRENCDDRYAAAQNTRDIIENNNRNNQAILDKLCALELSAKDDRIADLERQLAVADRNAAETRQTAIIREGQIAEVDALYNRLRDCPIGTMPVYGSQQIFTCPNNNSGCGCGCNGNF